MSSLIKILHIDPDYQIALESDEETRGLAFMLGSDTEMEWIEELEMADAIKREKKQNR